MRITFDCPDEWREKLVQSSKLNGDSSISVIIRKALLDFFSKESQEKSVVKNKESKC